MFIFPQAYPNQTNAIEVKSGDTFGFAFLGNNPLYAKMTTTPTIGSDIGVGDLDIISYPSVGDQISLSGISFSIEFPLAVEIGKYLV
jgi:hypothetical protein